MGGRLRNKRTPAQMPDEYSVLFPVKKPVDFSSKSSDYRKDAIKAARDFGYGDEVIQKIKAAKNDYQISGIMQVARHEAIERDRKRGKK